MFRPPPPEKKFWLRAWLFPGFSRDCDFPGREEPFARRHRRRARCRRNAVTRTRRVSRTRCPPGSRLCDPFAYGLCVCGGREGRGRRTSVNPSTGVQKSRSGGYLRTVCVLYIVLCTRYVVARTRAGGVTYWFSREPKKTAARASRERGRQKKG